MSFTCRVEVEVEVRTEAVLEVSCKGNAKLHCASLMSNVISLCKKCAWQLRYVNQYENNLVMPLIHQTGLDVLIVGQLKHQPCLFVMFPVRLLYFFGSC